jgi:hypothetical protein
MLEPAVTIFMVLYILVMIIYSIGRPMRCTWIFLCASRTSNRIYIYINYVIVEILAHIATTFSTVNKPPTA